MHTIPLEADTRILINKTLENLGWIFTGEKKNVYLEQPKTENERKLLNGKKPDYVLYSKNERYEDKAIMVIEAKRKGERVDKALEQGIRYAKQLDAPIVFATDGLFCKSYHTKFDKTPILNGEEVDELLRETLAIKYLATWEVNTVSPKVQYDRKELIKIFDDANNMLRGDGLRAGIERFGEFANILFLKLANENSQILYESGKKPNLDPACRWDSIKNIPSSTRIDYINNLVFKRLNDSYQTTIFTPLTMRSDDILKEIMDKLDPLTLTDVDSDVKGDAFEYFLRASTATKNDLGEYFAPRHIVKTMVKLVNPQIGEKIYDPFCGTGGFLIESFRHIWNTMAQNDNNKEILEKNTVFGNEITNTARITKMNMILAGDGHSNIYTKDNLANPIDGTGYHEETKIVDGREQTILVKSGYDVVITNMPYSQKSKHGHLYDMPSNNGDSICVQHCMKAVNSAAPNGRMALVVPEGFLFRKDLSRTRELLLKNCDLQSIISLPQGVFLPYTGVKTNILYATKINQNIKPSQKRKDFWYFDVKSDGYSLDNHRRKLESGSDLDKYQEYRKLDNDQQQEMLNVGFEVVPLDKVRENSHILVGSRYREYVHVTSSYEYVELREVAEIIAGQSPNGEHYNENGDGLPFYQGNANFGDVYINAPTKWTRQTTKVAIAGDILLSVRAPVGAVNICNATICIGRGLMAIRSKDAILNSKYFFYVLRAADEKLQQFSSGSTFAAINKNDVEKFKIPLPSLEMQQQIVDELDGYQRIIDGAKSVVESYSPTFSIKPEWDVVALSDVCSFEYGYTDVAMDKGNARFVRITDIDSRGMLSNSDAKYVNIKDENKKFLLETNDVLVARIGSTYGKTLLFTSKERSIFASYLIRLRFNAKILPKYYWCFAQSENYWSQAKHLVTGGGQPQFNANTLKLIKLPIPPVDVQSQIIAQIEQEQAIIEPSKQVIEVFTKKMQNRINEIWGE
ncbi:MAG: N-6 DNA methylase [Firmicutes bacterium]|nr:N-6 DNA methylase [Bacillota bacterium]